MTKLRVWVLCLGWRRAEPQLQSPLREALRPVLCLAGCPRAWSPERGQICGLRACGSLKDADAGAVGVWKRSEGAFPDSSFLCWGAGPCLGRQQRRCPRQPRRQRRCGRAEAAAAVLPVLRAGCACPERERCPCSGEICASSEFNRS